jgi:hypothetical protein
MYIQFGKFCQSHHGRYVDILSSLWVGSRVSEQGDASQGEIVPDFQGMKGKSI